MRAIAPEQVEGECRFARLFRAIASFALGTALRRWHDEEHADRVAKLRWRYYHGHGGGPAHEDDTGTHEDLMRTTASSRAEEEFRTVRLFRATVSEALENTLRSFRSLATTGKYSARW